MRIGHAPSVVDDLAELAPRIAIVQLGDAKQPPQGEQNRCRLGDGVIPLAQIVETLTQSGYTGYFEAKLLGEDVESFDYQQLITHSKSAFESWAGRPM